MALCYDQLRMHTFAEMLRSGLLRGFGLTELDEHVRN